MQAMKKLKAAGFSLADIAREIGCERQTVGHWARDRNAPNANAIAVMIKLGETKGMTFLASDFLPEQQEAA